MERRKYFSRDLFFCQSLSFLFTYIIVTLSGISISPCELTTQKKNFPCLISFFSVFPVTVVAMVRSDYGAPSPVPSLYSNSPVPLSTTRNTEPMSAPNAEVSRSSISAVMPTAGSWLRHLTTWLIYGSSLVSQRKILCIQTSEFNVLCRLSSLLFGLTYLR